MRKVIGIGETILDIIFKNGVPTAAIPGGSSFNGIVSLARAGVETCFISEAGNDRVGDTILQFMQDNHINADYIDRFPDGKSPVSLAFLDTENEASYLFYKDYPSQRLNLAFPVIEADDIVLFGAYYSLNPALRPRIVEFLEYAKSRKAILYYDPNFRITHRDKALKLQTSILENMEYADLVRGAIQDFSYMFDLNDAIAIYEEKVRFYCPNFICTHAEEPLLLQTRQFKKEYPIPLIPVVSTIGAGDNFNAGIIYGLLKYQVTREELYTLGEKEWERLIRLGLEFSADVCQSYNNSINPMLAQKYRETFF